MDIITFPNFITDKECNAFIELSTNKVASNFTDSGKFTNKKWVDYELTNLFFCRLKELTNDSRYIKPNNLIMSGSYKPGDSFGLHTDTGLFYSKDTNTKSKWTLLIYLNNNFEGGETVFYDTDTWKEHCRIKPEKGKALLFDIDLWHRGMEITDGMKHWIGCEIIGYMN